MGFQIPVKQIIVNSDTQTQLLTLAGVAYDGSTNATPTTGGFQLKGFLNGVDSTQLKLLRSATRVIKDDAASAGVAEIASYLIAASGGSAKAGDTFRVLTDSLDLQPTEFQNNPIEKRYQLSVDCANAAAIVANLVLVINADKNSMVTAYAGFNNASPVQDNTASIVLIAKTKGQTANLYRGAYGSPDQVTYTVTATKAAAGVTIYHTAEDTSAVTAEATLPLNTYEYLKNISWPKNLDFDRNPEWLPAKDTNYVGYYFEIVSSSVVDMGDNDVPSSAPASATTGFKLWVKSGLTLDTALDALKTDMNV